jgi:hypothetical protein
MKNLEGSEEGGTARVNIQHLRRAEELIRRAYPLAPVVSARRPIFDQRRLRTVTTELVQVWVLVPIDWMEPRRDYNQAGRSEIVASRRNAGQFLILFVRDTLVLLVNLSMFTLRMSCHDHPSAATNAALRGETRCLGHTQNLQFRRR